MRIRDIAFWVGAALTAGCFFLLVVAVFASTLLRRQLTHAELVVAVAMSIAVALAVLLVVRHRLRKAAHADRVSTTRTD